jgi:transposase
MTPHRDISEDEWQRVLPLLPELRPRSELRGRPLANTRSVLNGVLWVMYSGATWSAMPRRYPSYQTCHRRFKAWYDEGVLKRVMAELFGEEGIALCDSIETRMRKHLSDEEKGARNERPSVQQPATPVFGSATPAVPQPFAYPRTLFRQIA